MISVAELSALFQVIVVDLVLAGDNAIVVGMVAAGMPREMRARVIVIGIAAATVMRVAFAVVTSQLLQIIGLTLAGGLLLLWVCWKLWREIMEQRRERIAGMSAAGEAEAIPRRLSARRWCRL
jgi:predicted tellurium resistance membrane protein TerC